MKERCDVSYFWGTTAQIFGAKKDMVSVPYLTVFEFLLNSSWWVLRLYVEGLLPIIVGSVFTFFYFPLITSMQENFHIYSPLHCTFYKRMMKKARFFHSKGKLSDGYVAVDTSWHWSLFHLLLWSSWDFYFENRVILCVPINHPKPILQ